MSKSNELYDEQLKKLLSINISDALDALGIHGSTCGIRPMAKRWTEIVGPTVAVRMTAVGRIKQKTHPGMGTISAAEKGDVTMTDNGGRTDTFCRGGILANVVKAKGISGTVIDGCCRDLNDYMDADYTVYARGTVACMTRGHVIEESTNQMIQLGGVQVRPGNIVMGDNNGVVIIPQKHMETALLKTGKPQQKEEDMMAEIRFGVGILEADVRCDYNRMLQK